MAENAESHPTGVVLIAKIEDRITIKMGTDTNTSKCGKVVLNFDVNDFACRVNNKFSKQEHRFKFEMKVARENERKREEEEQQQQWLKLFFSQAQPPLPGMMLPRKYEI